MNNSGGEEKHKLTEDEMPSHDHSISCDGYDNEYNNQGFDLGGGTYKITKDSGIMTKTTYTGNNQKHNNMPPFYTLAYIIKI